MASFTEKAKQVLFYQDLSAGPMSNTATLTDIHINVNAAVKEGRVTVMDVQMFEELVQQSGFNKKLFSSATKTGKDIVICAFFDAPDKYVFHSARTKL